MRLRRVGLVRARLVEQASEWRWSSAPAHLRGEDAGLLDLVPWRAHPTPESWKLYLDKGLQDAALIKRIRAEWKEQKAQPLAQPPETMINLEMAAT